MWGKERKLKDDSNIVVSNWKNGATIFLDVGDYG